MPAYIRSVNVGPARSSPHAGLGRTAFDKRPVHARVRAHPLGLDGDEQANRRHHGGLDQAVYAFAREDLDRWHHELGRELPDGAFGENLTTVGIDLNDVVIGERWAVGEAEFEVSCPRVPCRTFARVLGEPRWIKRFTAQGRSGAYLRVLGEGTVGAGDEIRVLARPTHGVTAGETFRAMLLEPELLPRLLDVPELPTKIRQRARAHLGAQDIP
ncbi:MAG: MOSC domain-containing protein [Sporichthyaceae bacterium]